MLILLARLWEALKVARTKAWAVVEEADAELNLTTIGHDILLVHTSLENLEIDIWLIRLTSLEFDKNIFSLTPTYLHL